MLERYSTEYISRALSLRKPQSESLEILHDILSSINLRKGMDLETTLNTINNKYPICTDFGRDFLSLAFVLATGVGKTRLMGAFMTYLYTLHGIRNFFVVAPNKTIYHKLLNDFGDSTSSKYVFRGLDCFSGVKPEVITGERYRFGQIQLQESPIRIFVYNISKFDNESRKMHQENENLGHSFFEELSTLDDLVLLMDESHHYHADKGAKALDDLKPLMGIELTATPYYKQGSKEKTFTNAVYEYPLSASIRDGYTRTPYALTRSDINLFGFGTDELDRVMLNDALVAHENIIEELKAHAQTRGERAVKPFMMVVCKDTDHADNIYAYITSVAFANGRYADKTLVIHSNQTKKAREANDDLLQSVESPDNPIEIVIHVGVLGEGWDVNNLYTIVPLRTAASKVLREQMVGRGLRLPYGERTGIQTVDMVVLTAHDNFNELIKEAQKGDSIFRADCVIKAEEMTPTYTNFTQVELPITSFEEEKVLYDLKLDPSKTKNLEVARTIICATHHTVSEAYSVSNKSQQEPSHQEMVQKAKEKIEEALNKDKDVQEVYNQNLGPIFELLNQKTEEVKQKTIEKFIPIPKLKITQKGATEYVIKDFDLDTTVFKQVPTSDEILLQNLEQQQERISWHGQGLSLNDDPKKTLISRLREVPEIDYEQYSELFFKLISQLLAYFAAKFGEKGMKNIVYMNTRELVNEIKRQILSEEHFVRKEGFIEEKVVSMQRRNLVQNYTYKVKQDLYAQPDSTVNISSILFESIKKGVFSHAKFDSFPELLLARVLEQDQTVKNWLRPAPEQFEIFYQQGRRYEPDFVVETEDSIYLVEVKGEDKLNYPDVIAKKERGIAYCALVSDYARANNLKQWSYLFIPAGKIQANSSFKYLSEIYSEK